MLDNLLNVVPELKTFANLDLKVSVQQACQMGFALMISFVPIICSGNKERLTPNPTSIPGRLQQGQLQSWAG